MRKPNPMGNVAEPDIFDQLLEESVTDPAETETETATADPVESTVESGAPSARRNRAAALVAALLIAALAYSGYAGWRLHQLDARAAAAQSALAAAKDYAIALTTLDTADIDGNYARALDGATGAFKEAYSLGAKQLRQILIDNKASGKGVVIDAAVKSATTSRVEVLLFVDQSITNAVRSEPRIDRNRIQMTMERVDGRWLAGQVDLI
ncbi:MULTISPECIES: Mce protein [Mycolicibacter]|uniref:Mce protein n=1 Tax=[Mycobacterium] vasticus TaxID=2875777 RepID=A0ABU5YYZ5_9MYCO|nr:MULTISPECIES: Mce protein [unclassified Mycolicibacter]MEB3062144.1 Mce protein [Mycolicibacter sp. MYC101]MEB3070361.1 Mce protein [Mycolicibacter sp. MYC017]